MTTVTTNLTFDPSAISSLLRLRSMLQRAEVEARSPGEISRHVAIVMLDAAVENAVRISAHYRGLALRPEASFHDSVNKVTGGLSGWRPSGARGVLELHAARNLVQHVGILPDADRLAGWIVDAHTFVGGLVKAAFNTELRDVLMADAIREESLRDLIARAEESLSGQDPVQAFMLADTAFRSVRQRWRDRRREMRPGVARGSSLLLGDPDPTSNEGVVDFQEVQTFATSMAMYTQVLATRRHLQTGGPEPTADEAREAVAFIFNWILAWELFESGYPTERYAEYWTHVGPPHDGGPPAVAWVSPPERVAPRPGVPEEYQILVQFKNLPERGRGEWGIDLQSALDQAQDEAGVARQAVRQGSPLSLGATILVVQRELGAASFADVLHRAVELATGWLHERKAAQAARSLCASGMQVHLRETLADSTQGVGVYGPPVVQPEVTAQGPGFRVRIPVISPTFQDLNLAHSGFTGSGGGLAGAWVDGAEVTFSITDLNEALVEQIQQTVRGTQQTIQRYRQTDAEAEVRRKDYWQQLAPLLGEPPDVA